jgi:hypothetical protein
MKYTLLALLLCTNAYADFECYTDSFGYTHCEDDGGQTMSCYTDSFGYTHCENE